LTGRGVTAPAPKRMSGSRSPGALFIFKKALISALVALVLFSILIVVLIFLPTGLLGRPEVEKV
jgi:branched-subunit amino acid ABC-type transport system permease component